jgi:di/tricarboxylate transporter
MAPDDHPVAHVASSVVDSMKGSPILLAILLTNLITIGAIFWFASNVSEARNALIAKLIENCQVHKSSL